MDSKFKNTKDLYSNEEFLTLAKDVSETPHKNKTIDW